MCGHLCSLASASFMAGMPDLPHSSSHTHFNCCCSLGTLKDSAAKARCTAEVPVNDENPTGGSLGPRKELEDNLDRAGGHSVLKHLSRCLSQQGLILSMGII